MPAKAKIEQPFDDDLSGLPDIDIDADLPDIDAIGELGDDDDDIERDGDETPNPLSGVKQTGNAEADTKAECSAMLQAFKDRAKQENKRQVTALDSEYWFCVCFKTRDQKETFLRALNWMARGDKYLDGTELAKELDIQLPDEND